MQNSKKTCLISTEKLMVQSFPCRSSVNLVLRSWSLCLGPWQREAGLHAGGRGGGRRRGRHALRPRTEQPARGSVVPVQVLVRVPAGRSSETKRGEAKAGKAAARTGDHILLIHCVSAAGTERRQVGRVAGRGVIAIVGGGTARPGTPAQGSTHDQVVVVQTREGRQARGPVGDGRPPAVLEGRRGGLEGRGGVRRRGRQFGVRQWTAVLCVRGTGAVHWIIVHVLLVSAGQVQR